MSLSDDLRIIRMSNGSQLIGRLVEINDEAIVMDNVYSIVPITRETADYGLVPWLTGVEITDIIDINMMNVDVIAHPTDEFAKGWNEACESWSQLLVEEAEEEIKAAQGQLSKDEIDELLKEYETDSKIVVLGNQTKN